VCLARGIDQGPLPTGRLASLKNATQPLTRRRRDRISTGWRAHGQVGEKIVQIGSKLPKKALVPRITSGIGRQTEGVQVLAQRPFLIAASSGPADSRTDGPINSAVKCKEILNPKHRSRHRGFWGPASTEMRNVGIWVSGLLASAIPFIFVGAVFALLACVFDAVGEHAPIARSRASFQAEAAPPEQVLAVASADAPDNADQRQAGKHAHSDARRHQASRSCSHPRVRHTSVVNGEIAPSGRPRFANHFANRPPSTWHNGAIW
jgi:hypothetical protein